MLNFKVVEPHIFFPKFNNAITLFVLKVIAMSS